MSDYAVSVASSSTNSKAPVPREPANLRFQRRTSERAFYEGAYREGTLETPSPPGRMEYPGAGTDPWASSPEASRTSFGGEVPRQEALPGPAITQANGAHTREEEHAHIRQPQPYPYHPGQPGNWSPEQHQQWQQEHQQHSGMGEENRRPQSARYHGAPQHQHGQRQHVPNYKLQAKITGLERSGKKDPILRFDVYVCPAKIQATRQC